MENHCKIVEYEDSTCQEQFLALRDGLEILGGKWKLLLLVYLDQAESQKPHFKKIQRDLIGISAKMLTKELRELEENHMIDRTAQREPRQVFYSLTAHGRTAFTIAQDITSWGMMHREKIKEEMRKDPA